MDSSRLVDFHAQMTEPPLLPLNQHTKKQLNHRKLSNTNGIQSISARSNNNPQSSLSVRPTVSCYSPGLGLGASAELILGRLVIGGAIGFGDTVIAGETVSEMDLLSDRGGKGRGKLGDVDADEFALMKLLLGAVSVLEATAVTVDVVVFAFTLAVVKNDMSSTSVFVGVEFGFEVRRGMGGIFRGDDNGGAWIVGNV
jgi:hypothetical protein